MSFYLTSQARVRRTAQGSVIVSFEDERLRTVTAAVSVQGGSRDEPAHLTGTTHLFEHLLMASPQAIGDSRSVVEILESLGGESNAFTAREALVLWARLPQSGARDGVEALVEAAVAPHFDADTLKRERNVVHQELLAQAADSSNAVHNHFFGRLFPQDGLGRSVGGDEASLARMDLPLLRSLHRDLFVASRVMLVIIGPDADYLAARAAEGPLTDLVSGPDIVRNPPAHPPTAAQPLEVDPAASYVHACAGGRSVGRRSSRWASFEVLHHLLAPSSTSLLYQRLRNELEICYELLGWHSGYTGAGAWRVTLGVAAEHLEQATLATREVVRDVVEGRVDEGLLRAATAQAEFRLLRTLEDPVLHAEEISLGWYDPTDPESLPAMHRGLHAVDLRAVRDAAAQVLESWTVAASPVPRGAEGAA